MGKTQRKTNKYLALYRNTLKRKVNNVIGFTPPATDRDGFLRLFGEVYPDDVQSMEKHYRFYQEKNKRRRVGKPLYFPSPSELLYEIARFKISSVLESTWNAEAAAEKKKSALEEAELERQKRKEKYRKNNISTQEVTPKYIISLFDRYWKENQKLLRLYAIQECAKYKNTKTIYFFRQVLHGENDWFIRNYAFRTLQKFDEVAYLPPKGDGSREKYDTLVNLFGCDYKEDIGKGPLDIMREFNQKDYIQTARDFDVFISHSVSNSQIVDHFVHLLNDVGLVAFVDWKSDKEDLSRSKTNQYSADVLRLRMRQSKCLILIRTKESDSSAWVSWELGYFSALERPVAVMTAQDQLDQAPEFISGLPSILMDGDRLQVIEEARHFDFTCWLQKDRGEVE